MTIIDRFFALCQIVVILTAIGALIVSGFIPALIVAAALGLPLMGIKWVMTGRTGNKRDA